MNLPANASSPGFTLLEMVIALFILMLLSGLAVVGTRNVLADEEIRDAVRKLQLFAKTARKEAVETSHPQKLLLAANSWELQQVIGTQLSPGSEGSPSGSKILRYELPPQIHWKVKKWGESKWQTPREMGWDFASSGLCSPLRFRFERGNSWIELSFNPLTANAQDEDFYLP